MLFEIYRRLEMIIFLAQEFQQNKTKMFKILHTNSYCFFYKNF